MPNPAYLLEARAVHKSYGATRVLRGVDFAVAAAEIHALLGGNGAGKSTLLKIVTGAVPRDAGEVLYRGVDVGSHEGAAARARGVAVVHQETALLPDLTVAENIHMPHLARGAGLFSAREAARVAEAALGPIDAAFAQRALHRRVAELTLHERQVVEIARALSAGAQLLLLDEPTANLTAAETERLFALLRRLIGQQGISVVFVSHRMREIREIASVCTILRDGVSAVSRARLTDLSDADIVTMMGQATALEGAARITAATPALARPDTASPGEAFGAESGAMRLEIPPGHIVGLAGAPAGPSALIDALIGARRDSAWRVTRGGRPLALRSPREAVRQGIGFVSGDRAGKGVLATLPIVDNMLAAARIRQRRALVARREVQEGEALLRTLRIKASSLWALPATLSGGTQQKLLIARWLNLAPRLLVLEEPTRGVDIGTKRDLYALVRQMAERGVGVVWWSTEYVELVELCHAVLAFGPDGTPSEILTGQELDETHLAHATGMAA
jgi:ribose transport system ATP-binding protein